MKITVSINGFRCAFETAGRKDQFSREGQEALFRRLEEIEEDTGEEIELDVIALCCDFSEYTDAIGAAQDFGFDDEAGEDEEAAMRWLQERTTVIEFDGGMLVQSF